MTERKDSYSRPFANILSTRPSKDTTGVRLMYLSSWGSSRFELLLFYLKKPIHLACLTTYKPYLFRTKSFTRVRHIALSS